MVFKRTHYLERLESSRDNGFVKIVTGARRCGKSYLLFRLFRRRLLKSGVSAKNIVAVELDDDKNESLRNPHKLGDFIRSKLKGTRSRYYVLIDEIQYCYAVPLEDNPKVEFTFYDTLNGLLKLPNVDIYVTGSNSHLLSKDVATHFRDRGEEIRVHPLTFAEVHEAFGGDIYRTWNDYLVFGGLPGALLKKTDAERRDYLTRLFETTYLRDIVERYDLRDDYALGKMVDVVSSAVGSLTNPTKLTHAMQNELGVRISIPTVQKYLGFLTDSFLFDRAERYDVKGKRYLDYPSKYYAEDVGLRNARLGFRQVEVDHLMENVVYNELKARGYRVDVGVVLTEEMRNGVRQHKQREIDFVVNLGRSKVYIQCAYAIESQSKRDQETASLERSGDSFRKIVVVATPQPRCTDEKGITTIGIMDLLLSDRGIDSFLGEVV